MREFYKDGECTVINEYRISWAKDPVQITTDICIENIDCPMERYRIHIPYFVKDEVVEESAKAFIRAFNDAFRGSIPRAGLE